jgi:adenylyltransferase/sulfurtransferase
MPLSPAELLRYSRHLSLPQVGIAGQERLARARVLIVGAGGLGSPAALYLAAAGVGTLGIIDFDRVDVTNLQRQILHDTPGIGRAKTDSARERIAAINPHVAVETHDVALDASNALDLIARYDLVLDGTDNFRARYLVNDACVMLGTPNVYGSVHKFEGQLAVLATRDGPCYRCLYREPPPPGLVPSCAEAGVLGVLPGLVGTMQATEALKLILGLGEPMIGRLLLIDALGMRFRTIRVPRDPSCPMCGTRTIRELVAVDEVCDPAMPEEAHGRAEEPRASGRSQSRGPVPGLPGAQGALGAPGGPPPRGEVGSERADGHTQSTARNAERAHAAPGGEASDDRAPTHPEAVRVSRSRSPSPGLAPQARVRDITARELAALLARGAPLALVDVREPWEWSIAHLADATLIPLGRIQHSADELPRDRDVVLYCHHGARSRMAAEYLASLGVRAVNLEGGIDAWSREVDPEIPRY